MQHAIRAARVFDGDRLLPRATVVLDGAQIAAVLEDGEPRPAGLVVRDLGTGVLAPGLVDLQVNGGGGIMLGARPDCAAITQICAAHARLGATSILPTLITDTREVTARVIASAIAAARTQVPGFAGLHLEGPHLDPRRKGAHDSALIRPMTGDDLDQLLKAAHELPVLMLTLAPEAVTLDQIAQLTRAGVVVSLGHSDCTSDDALAAHRAGARAVTHLFNAMSQLQGRAPGLVGAALGSDLRAGIIADRVHVSDEALVTALRASHPDRLFLISDAMAVAGTELAEFTLGTRRVLRRANRLMLEDGTLAGADLSLPRAMANMVALGCPVTRALAMASRIPADLIGAEGKGRLTPGVHADLVYLDAELALQAVWQGGKQIEQF